MISNTPPLFQNMIFYVENEGVISLLYQNSILGWSWNVSHEKQHINCKKVILAFLAFSHCYCLINYHWQIDCSFYLQIFLFLTLKIFCTERKKECDMLFMLPFKSLQILFESTSCSSDFQINWTDHRHGLYKWLLKCE